MKSAHLLLVIAVSMICSTCRENTTGPSPASLELTLADAGATEAWVRVKTPELAVGSTYTLKRDGKPVFSTQNSFLDTVVVCDSLLPNHTYLFQTFRSSNSVQTDLRSQLSVTTMDTTSNNITWALDVLGDGNSSILHDVAIINDTCVWAVGEIYKKDTSGQFESVPYNAARWNGQEWSLFRIQFRLDYSTNVIYSYTGIKSIFAFSADDIWFVHHVGGVTRLVGGNWIMMDFPLVDGPGDANKIWGTSSTNLYFVASVGRIVYYDGNGWTKLESGTTSNINDVFGIFNKEDADAKVFCAVSSFFTPGDQKILKISNGGNVIDSIAWGTGRNIFSVWTQSGFIIYTAGSGVFENKKGYWREAQLPSVYTNCIRGTSLADIFTVGDFGLVAHYNGINWHVYTDFFNGGYSKVSVNSKMVVCVGQRDGRGIVLRGTRN